MKKNSGIKILTLVVVSVVVLILINGKHQSTATQKPSNDPNNLNEAIASQFNDNIRDVAARLQETEKKLKDLEAQHKQLKNVHPDSNAQLGDASKTWKEEIEKLKAQISAFNAGETGNIPITNSTQPETLNHLKDIDQLLIKKQMEPAELGYWEKIKPKQIKKTSVTPSKQKKSPKVIPYYTIPAGSDLGQITLLSSLIGEVPVEGKLMQPLFPFSGIINREELMSANGIPLPPNIAGMKINGYAIGVGSFLDNISCVRAYVTSALFVFDDGHFVTVGKEEMQGTTDMINRDSIGYLTTAFGNPCIKGKYVTNAPRVLTALVAADGIKGAGNALSQWQMTYSTNMLGGTSTPTGSMGNYALGGAMSQGSLKGAEWLEKRVQGSFDMVFVPASTPSPRGYVTTKLAFHLTQTIKLDKSTHGRVLDYGYTKLFTHDFSLR